MQELKDIRGIIPAVMTCFDENGNFDAARQRTLVEFLLSKGVDALYIGGSSGEAFLMDNAERRTLVETTLKAARKALPSIIHVGDIGTRNSILLAQHAADSGADAISSLPPFYFKFSSSEIYSYYRDLSASTPLPLVIYNIALAGLLDFAMLKQLSELENIKGIKYTSSTHFEIQKIKEDIGPDFMVYSGVDEMMLSALIFGADGAIGTFYNLIPDIYHSIDQSFKTGNYQKAIHYQKLGSAVILEVLKYPYFSAIKRLLFRMGYDVGFTRKPFEMISDTQLKALEKKLLSIRDHYEVSGIELFKKLEKLH